MADIIPRPHQLPSVVPATPGDVIVSDSEITEACKELGLIRIKPKTIRALKKLGSVLDTSDLARIQAANVLITQERLSKLFDECEDIIKSSETDEGSVDAIKAATAICAESNRSCELTLKILHSKAMERDTGQTKLPPFQPGGVVAPVQINISTTKDSKVEIADGAK